MGVFDEKRTYIASSTLQLVEQTPNIITQSILNSVLANRDIVPDMIDAVMNSFAAKDVARMFEYAKNDYTNGLPEGSKGWAPAPDKTIEAVLAKEYPHFIAQGKSFRVVAASLGKPNPQFVCIEALVNDPNFIKWIRFDDDGGNPGWGRWALEYNTGEKNPNCGLDDFLFNWKDAPVFIGGWYITYLGQRYREWKYRNYHEPIHPDGTYYNVEYQVINPNGTIYNDRQWPANKRWWTYYPASKRYPELNLEGQGGNQPTGTFYFPVIPLRVNNTELNNKNTALYKTSKKLLNYVEVDIDTLHDAVLANPSIAEIDHAYVMFGVDVHTSSHEGNKYLFEFFQDEFTRQRTTKAQFMQWYNEPKWSLPPLNSVNIKDATYNVHLVWNYIEVSMYNGVIGQVGDVTKRIVIASKEPVNIRPPGSIGSQYEHMGNQVILRKQMTPNSYRQIIVSGLCYANNIHGSGKSWWTGLWGAVNMAAGDQPNAPIPVPLNVAIAYDSLSRLDANPLYYESLHVVFNSFKVVKLKWYETGLFQVFTQVIALAVGVMTGGIGNIISGITTAAAAGISALSVYIGKMLISTILGQYVFKLAAEKLGIDTTFTMAAALALYGVVGQEGLLNLPFATDLMFIGMELSKATQAVTSEIIEDVGSQGAEMSARYESEMERLEEINQQLNNNNLVDPLGIYTQVGMSPFDTPSSYIERSLITNPGLQSISAVTNFVDNSLRLPTMI